MLRSISVISVFVFLCGAAHAEFYVNVDSTYAYNDVSSSCVVLSPTETVTTTFTHGRGLTYVPPRYFNFDVDYGNNTGHNRIFYTSRIYAINMTETTATLTVRASFGINESIVGSAHEHVTIAPLTSFYAEGFNCVVDYFNYNSEQVDVMWTAVLDNGTILTAASSSPYVILNPGLQVTPSPTPIPVTPSYTPVTPTNTFTPVSTSTNTPTFTNTFTPTNTPTYTQVPMPPTPTALPIVTTEITFITNNGIYNDSADSPTFLVDENKYPVNLSSTGYPVGDIYVNGDTDYLDYQDAYYVGGFAYFTIKNTGDQPLSWIVFQVWRSIGDNTSFTQVLTAYNPTPLYGQSATIPAGETRWYGLNFRLKYPTTYTGQSRKVKFSVNTPWDSEEWDSGLLTFSNTSLTPTPTQTGIPTFTPTRTPVPMAPLGLKLDNKLYFLVRKAN